MKNLVVLLLTFCLSLGSFAQEVYKLYEGTAPGSENWTDPELSVPAPWSGNPLIYNVSDPTITVYRPNKAIDTGAAMIIAPGGGNRFLTWKEEGINVAEWFQRHGITGILLKYRTNQLGSLQDIEESLKATWPPTRNNNSSNSTRSETSESQRPPRIETEATLQGDDGRQAIKYIRQHAEEIGVNPEKIGIVGFSAGAMLAANVIFLHDESSRPNLVALIYGGGLTNEKLDRMPLFICSPVNDLFPANDIFQTYHNWKSSGIPAELHLIYDARHGDGLQYNDKAWNEWIDNLYNFMKAVDFVE
mgnify:CR=1 FL=1